MAINLVANSSNTCDVSPPPARSTRGLPEPPQSIFFFQAEDGIRAGRVTGVKTCALPLRRGSWTAPGLHRLTMTAGSGGSRSGTPRIGRAGGREGEQVGEGAGRLTRE